MPFYAPGEYGYEKMRMNPLNRGRWDLKFTGMYHKGITAKIAMNASSVHFVQKYNGAKVDWLHDRLTLFGTVLSLGITEEQMVEVQERIAPNVREELDKIINGV